MAASILGSLNADKGYLYLKVQTQRAEKALKICAAIEVILILGTVLMFYYASNAPISMVESFKVAGKVGTALSGAGFLAVFFADNLWITRTLSQKEYNLNKKFTFELNPEYLRRTLSEAARYYKNKDLKGFVTVEFLNPNQLEKMNNYFKNSQRFNPEAWERFQQGLNVSHKKKLNQYVKKGVLSEK